VPCRREQGNEGGSRAYGCTDPWGHAANGPAPAPFGRGLVSPQSSGPNGKPGRTVRPTEGRPFADILNVGILQGPPTQHSIPPLTPTQTLFLF